MKNKIMKNIYKILGILSIILIFTGVGIFFSKKSFGDVGNFKSYSPKKSSSSSKSFNWSSGSSSSSSSGGSFLGFIPFSSPLLLIILVAFVIYANKKRQSGGNVQNFGNMSNFNSEGLIEEKIKLIDPTFNKEEFKAYVANIYVRLQKEWTNQDWEQIRTFETTELFEQHREQLQAYIDRGQINVMDRVAVLGTRLKSFEQSGGKDIIVVEVNARANDYIIDAKTKKVVAGNPYEETFTTYDLTFTRTTGIQTNNSGSDIKTTNCPNCGAPTKITSSGRCEYCNSVITTKDHDWALADLRAVDY